MENKPGVCHSLICVKRASVHFAVRVTVYPISCFAIVSQLLQWLSPFPVFCRRVQPRYLQRSELRKWLLRHASIRALFNGGPPYLRGFGAVHSATPKPLHSSAVSVRTFGICYLATLQLQNSLISDLRTCGTSDLFVPLLRNPSTRQPRTFGTSEIATSPRFNFRTW